MLNRMNLIALLFLMACGQEVTLTNNKLERLNSVTYGEELKVEHQGSLLRSATMDTIITENQSHKVSQFSSQISLSYIRSKPVGVQVPVRYKGKVERGDLVLEFIQDP